MLSVSYSAAPAAIRSTTIATSALRSATSPLNRRFRLVDQQGDPHPVLDDLYDSLEAAWAEAQNWWHEHVDADQASVGIGIEVSTASGGWRTLRHPGV